MRNHFTFSAFLAGSFLATALFGGLRADEVSTDPGFALENGDTNGDLERDLSDPVYLLGYLFLGGPAPVELQPCATMPASVQNGDTNGDGTLDVSDAIYLFGWLFTGGPEPTNACAQRGRGGAKPDDNLEARADPDPTWMPPPRVPPFYHQRFRADDR